MGGGGAMRSAAKYVGVTAFRSPVPLVDHGTVDRRVSVSGALGLASVSAPALHSSSAVCGTSDAPLSGPRPVWDFDDGWEFAGDEHLFRDPPPPTRPPPPVVFGPVPSLDEAKNATSDLKDALEEICFSRSAGNKSIFSRHGTENSITKRCVSSQSIATLPSVPKHVMNAFSLLKESPQAEGVVAALASDVNVWEAVMKNEKVVEFYRLHHNYSAEPVAASDTDNFNCYVDHPTEGGVAGLFRNVKLKVLEMVSNISDFLQDVIGKGEEESNRADINSRSADFIDKTIGASFMALAILAIIVVLFKR